MSEKQLLLAGHPRGLGVLFVAELWERFSYYGMRALLMLFMVEPAVQGGLGLPVVTAAEIYGNYTMCVYMLSIVGGLVADRIMGARHAVLVGGTAIAAGHFALAVPTAASFYTGLGLIVLGTGLFKPSISALVGGLYKPGDTRRDAGFSIFYMGINIGGLAAPIVTGFLAQSEIVRASLAAYGLDPGLSWHLGFGAAGLGMTIGLFAIVSRLSELAGVGNRETIAGAARVSMSAGRDIGLAVLGTLAVTGYVMLSDRDGYSVLRWGFLLIPAIAALLLARSGNPALKRIAAVCVFFAASIIFFAMFEQAGVTIALFADRFTRTEIAGVAFPSAWVQSLNPLFVIVLAPLFAVLWTRLGQRQPSAPVKFALGLFCLAGSFLLMVPAAILAAEGKVSPLWLVGLFLLQTVGELCLSPVGLSTMTKLAPASMVGFVLGIWFLGTALGNKLASILGSSFAVSDPHALSRQFLGEAVFVAAAAIVMLALSPWVKRLMGHTR